MDFSLFSFFSVFLISLLNLFPAFFLCLISSTWRWFIGDFYKHLMLKICKYCLSSLCPTHLDTLYFPFLFQNIFYFTLKLPLWLLDYLYMYRLIFKYLGFSRFLLLISDLILLWPVNILCYDLMLLILFWFVLLPSRRSILVNVLCRPGEKKCVLWRAL